LQTLAVASGFERFGKQSRRAEFLAAMELVVPWGELVALIEPHYPDTGKGRPPVGVERMLRIYFLQQWFNLSDPGVEDARYDSLAMRGFASTLAASLRRMRRRCASSATCWNGTAWASASSRW
jgi:IS5 family transposase